MNFTNQPIQYKEETLIQHASDGNLDAFNQIVLRYQNIAYHHAYALLGDTASAEDATQESFIRAFQKIKTFRGGSFRGWLLRIVTNTCYDEMRKIRRHPLQPLYPADENGEEVESATWLADMGPSVQDTVEQNELSNTVYGALDQLPDAYRSVLTLADVYELDYTEVARILKIPLGTVKSRLARARLKMKEKLRGSFEYFKKHGSATRKSFASANAMC